VTRKISLSVNDIAINLDYFVAGYLDHVIGGILDSLKGTGEIKELELDIDSDGIVTINLNGAEVPINFFTQEIVKSTLTGVVTPLKGVTTPINKLEMKISR
jgi:hypothetical protein